MSIKVYNDFLNHNEFLSLSQEICLPREVNNITWNFVPFVVNQKDENQDLNKNFQFVHMAYNQNVPTSPLWNLIEGTLIRAIEPLSVIRVKINLNPYCGQDQYEHGYHSDLPHVNMAEAKTAVFYLNTCDGYTKFKDTGEKVYSKENTLVEFPCHMKHTGSNLTDGKARYVINLNYIK